MPGLAREQLINLSKELICTRRNKISDKREALAEARAFAPLGTDGTEYAFSLMGIEGRRVTRSRACER